MQKNEIMDDKDKIFQKWKHLQNIILQEKLLIDALFKGKNNNYVDIKKLIYDLSETKYKINQIMFRKKRNNNFENSISKEKNNEIIESIEYLSEENELYKDIKNLLFFLRKNIDYVLKIIKKLYETKRINDDAELYSFIQFLLNNFYGGFPMKKSINKNLMVIIYKLFEYEICNMDYAISDSFINSNYLFDKFLEIFLLKDENIKYLETILNTLVCTIEKEIEDKTSVNLSLIEIKNNIINKNIYNIKENESISRFKRSLSENNLNIEEIDKTELIYYIWKNQEEFFNDLTKDNLIKRWKKKTNKDIRDIIIRKVINKNLYNNKENKDIFSNKRLVDVLNTNYFNNNFELLVNKYKANYLFIHQKIDSFLLELIGNINLIPNNIRYICKIIYLLISAKFPFLPKYLKNSFIGKFFFDKYIFPCLLFNNKLVFNNRIISTETKKCIGDIISLLSFVSNYELFDNYNNTEKALFNNYIIEIIPILDKFYNLCIDIRLPQYLEKLVNLKVKDIEKNKNIKYSRKKKVEKLDYINIKNNIFISELLKGRKSKKNSSIKSFLWKFEYICFSLQNILYILSLINKNKNIFLNLPKSDTFNDIFQSIINQKEKIQLLISKNMNKEKFYIIYEIKKENFTKFFRNTLQENINLFYKNSNNFKIQNLHHIKFCIKILLQEINLINISNSNKNFFLLLLYLSLVKKQYDLTNINKIKKIPLYWFGKYLIKQIKLLEDKYIIDDFEELYKELYEDELYNINRLNRYWDKIIIKNEENIKNLEKNIMELKSKLNYIQKSYYINQSEKIIYFQKIEAYIILNTKRKKNKNENMPNIKIEIDKTNNENEIKINTIEEFINIFSPNFLLSSEQKINPYNLLLSDITKGENKYKIDGIIFKYLSTIKKVIKSNYKDISKNDIDEILIIIKDYILESIYKLVFPKNPTDNDISFYNKTKELDWITKENFGIKDIELYQIYYPEKIMNKFEESKSLNEKIKYIKYIHKYINDIFKFNKGKDEEVGQDESTPFIQYLIIRCQPERIVSNINFIKYFLSEEELMGDKGFFISQIDSAIIFVLSINHTHLEMSEEEFNKKVQSSKIKNKLI